jgi:hypothetical protein
MRNPLSINGVKNICIFGNFLVYIGRFLVYNNLVRKPLQNMHPNAILAEVYESYERNGDQFVMFNTEEAATNHDLFEVGHVSKAQVWLNEKGYAELVCGFPIW